MAEDGSPPRKSRATRINSIAGDAYTLGFLNAASGLGALIGALYLASRRSVLGLGRVIVGTTVVLGRTTDIVDVDKLLRTGASHRTKGARKARKRSTPP